MDPHMAMHGDRVASKKAHGCLPGTSGSVGIVGTQMGFLQAPLLQSHACGNERRDSTGCEHQELHVMWGTFTANTMWSL